MPVPELHFPAMMAVLQPYFDGCLGVRHCERIGEAEEPLLLVGCAGDTGRLGEPIVEIAGNVVYPHADAEVEKIGGVVDRHSQPGGQAGQDPRFNADGNEQAFINIAVNDTAATVRGIRTLFSGYRSRRRLPGHIAGGRPPRTTRVLPGRCRAGHNFSGCRRGSPCPERAGIKNPESR